MDTLKNTLYLIILITGVFLLGIDTVLAQTDPNNTLDSVVDSFADNASAWTTPLIDIASKVFWSLVLIDLVLVFGKLALEGSAFDAFGAELVRRMLFVGFGVWVLENPTFAFDLVDGFRDASEIATGHRGMTPSNILDDGVRLVGAAGEFSIWDGASWGAFFGSIIVLVCVALIAAWIVITLCEMYIVIFGGVILLGFLGSQYTKEYAMRYIGYLFSVGMKLFVIQVIAGLGIALLSGWIDEVEAGEGHFLIMAAASIVLAALTMQLPNIVQSFISGVSSSDGMSAVKTSAAITGGAAGAAAGAAVSAGGGVMAVSEAAKLASSQGASGGMSMTAGTVKNLASSFANDMQSSMAGSNMTSSGTMGGRMAAAMKEERLGGSGSSGFGGGSSSGSVLTAGAEASSLFGSISRAEKPSSSGQQNVPAGGTSADSNSSYISGAPSDDQQRNHSPSHSSGSSNPLTVPSESVISPISADGNADAPQKTDTSSVTTKAAMNAASGGVTDLSSDDIARMDNKGGKLMGDGLGGYNRSQKEAKSNSSNSKSERKTNSLKPKTTSKKDKS